MNKDRIWTLLSRKLSGEAIASELTELDNLIETDKNAVFYQQAIEEFWNIPTEKDEEFLEATFHLHLKRLNNKGFKTDIYLEKEEFTSFYFDNETTPIKKITFKKVMLATSVIAAAACFLLFFILFKVENTTKLSIPEKIAQSEVSTKSGSRTKIQLPDGSSVWLNGSSKLVYDNRHFGEIDREVTLSGEGYFDVVKNKDKPFIIHANKIIIKVLGTAFNVEAYPGEKNTVTSLIRGSIEVTMKDRKDKIMMKPNDKLVIANEDLLIRKSNLDLKKNTSIKLEPFISMSHLTLAKDESTIIETAWVDNKLVFDNETFEDVALKMEKWYGVHINFTDEKLKLELLTGTFEKETVTEALSALQLSTPIFKYKISNQIIKIFKQ